jgi:hypothetical protein
LRVGWGAEAPLIERDRLSRSAEAALDLVGEADWSEPDVTACDEYGEFSLELSPRWARPWRSLLALSLDLSFVLALTLLRGSTSSAESQSSIKAARGFLVLALMVKVGRESRLASRALQCLRGISNGPWPS